MRDFESIENEFDENLKKNYKPKHEYCEECGEKFELPYDPIKKKYVKTKKCKECILKQKLDTKEIQTQLKFVPYEWQEKVIDSHSRIKIIHAASRSGKDYVTANIFIAEFIQMLNEPHRADNVPRVLGWIVTPTNKLAKQMWRYIKKFMPRDIVLSVKNDEASREITTVNGGEIQVMSADDPNTLVGVGLDILWVSEAARIRNFEDVWTNLRRRIESKGVGPNGKGGLALVNSSPFGRGFFYKLCQMGYETSPIYDSDCETFHASAWDNPEEAKKRHYPNEYTIALSKEFLISIGFLKIVNGKLQENPNKKHVRLRFIKYNGLEKREYFNENKNIKLVGFDYRTDTLSFKFKTMWCKIEKIILIDDFYDEIKTLIDQKDFNVVRVGRNYEENWKVTLSEKAYQEDILGKFADVTSGQFKNFRSKCYIERPYFQNTQDKNEWIRNIENPKEDRKYAIGYDPAKYIDGATVLVRDYETNEVVKLYQFKNMDYKTQVQQVYYISQRYNKAKLFWGRTGHVVLEELFLEYDIETQFIDEQGLNKSNLVENLTTVIQNGEFKVYETDELSEELVRQFESYEYTVNEKTKRIIYGGNKEHDDFVSAAYFAYSDVMKQNSFDEIESMPITLTIKQANLNNYKYGKRR